MKLRPALVLFATMGCVEASSAAPVETTVAYEEVWRSETAEDAPYVLGTPGRVRADSLGSIYVLDTQLQQIHRFDSQGQYLGVILGPGEGPGDLQRCLEFDVWPGGRIAIPRAQGSVGLFDLRGSYLRSLVVGNDAVSSFTHGMSVSRRGNTTAAIGFRREPTSGPEQRVLGVYAPDGSTRRELFVQTLVARDHSQPQITIRERDSFFPGSRFVLGGDGLLYVAPDREAFHVVVFGAVILAWVLTKPEQPPTKNGPRRARSERPKPLI